MNILIVDDEYYIVQGIINDIDWKSLGIEEVFSAYSARQAQEIFSEHSIDILLSDIAMPRGESGLGLLQWAHDHGHCPVALFLTGHQSFDYAKEAIRMRCIGYLLKPVDPKQLEQELLHAVQIVQESRQEETLRQIAHQWNSNKQNLEHLFWYNLIFGNTPSTEDEIRRALHQFQPEEALFSYTYYCILICIRKVEPVNPNGQTGLTALINSLIPDFLSTDASTSLTKLSNSEYILVHRKEENQSSIEHFKEMQRFLLVLRKQFADSLNFFLSDEKPITEICQTCQKLRTLENSLATRSDIVFQASKMIPSEQLYSLFSVPVTQPEEWAEKLLEHRIEDILSEINDCFSSSLPPYCPDSMIVTLYHTVVQAVYIAFHRKNLSAEELLTDPESHSSRAWQSQLTASIDNFLFWANDYLSSMSKELSSESNSFDLVNSIKEFILTHLASEELNRNFIAAEIHLCPDYLSYVFHKKSGESLGNFISEERIKAAKKLLLDSDASIQEIAERTGFSNLSYFHRKFKKMTGMTPQQYRMH